MSTSRHARARALQLAFLALGLWFGVLVSSAACSRPSVGADEETFDDAGSDGQGGGGGGDTSGGDGGQSTLPDAGQNAPRSCNPFAQTGCPSDKPKCGLVVNQFACTAAGAIAENDTCVANGSGDDCQAGLFCLNGKCRRQCDQDLGNAACPSGSICDFLITVNGGPPAGERFYACSKLGAECDVLRQDCADPALACYASSSDNKCFTPGATADLSACAYANDCKKGSTCLNVGAGFKCYPVCSRVLTDGGFASDAGVLCASGSCTALPTLADGGELDYGLCQ